MKTAKTSATIAMAAATIVLLLPVLYFLSFGPVAWLIGKGYVVDGPMMRTYAWPGYWAVARSPQLRGVMVPYLYWCAGAPLPPDED